MAESNANTAAEPDKPQEVYTISDAEENKQEGKGICLFTAQFFKWLKEANFP